MTMTFRNTSKGGGVLALVLGGFLYGNPGAAQVASAASPVDFSREVRPILSQSCFTCHGPAEDQRRGGLRLDTPGGFFRDQAEGGPVIVPGSAEESLLYQRITSEVERERMPRGRLGAEAEALTADEIATIRLWIDQGAERNSHWAFIAPERPALPPVESRDWVRNPIDNFVLARLEQEGLSPSPEPDRATLIRRVSLDLTGLPPTMAEVDAFLVDDSPNAYEVVVDRLLESPRYGERMAFEWLDVAR